MWAWLGALEVGVGVRFQMYKALNMACERETRAGMTLISMLAVAVFTETYTGEGVWKGKVKSLVWTRCVSYEDCAQLVGLEFDLQERGQAGDNSWDHQCADATWN